MRRVLLLACFLLSSGAIRAGVYVTTPREPFPVPTAYDRL